MDMTMANGLGGMSAGGNYRRRNENEKLPCSRCGEEYRAETGDLCKMCKKERSIEQYDKKHPLE